MSRHPKKVNKGWQGPGHYSETKIVLAKNDSYLDPKAKRCVEDERSVYIKTEQEFNFRFGRIKSENQEEIKWLTN